MLHLERRSFSPTERPLLQLRPIAVVCRQSGTVFATPVDGVLDRVDGEGEEKYPEVITLSTDMRPATMKRAFIGILNLLPALEIGRLSSLLTL